MTKAGIFAPPKNPGGSFVMGHVWVVGVSSFVIRLLTLAIRAYQLVISPAQLFLFGPAGGCRFTPTCSQYALEALRERGVLAGGVLAAKRICRCHPWGGCGYDPVEITEGGRDRGNGAAICPRPAEELVK